MEESQTMNNTDRDFPSEENLNSNVQNEVKQISIKNGIKPIEKQLSSNKEVISQSWPVLATMFTFFSIFFFIFSFTLRIENNLLIPLAFLFQAWAFLLTPILLIRQNDKLKTFVVNNLKAFKNDAYKLCFFRLHNKIYPFNVSV